MSKPRASDPDVVVIGSGPNGLTAAVLLARAGLRVHVVEAAATPGGGCRSAELTLPGFVHDTCAAVHPMGIVSPAFRELDLEKFGLEWTWSRVPLAHPLPDGSVAVLDRSLEKTSAPLGADGPAWSRLLAPFSHPEFIATLLHPIWRPPPGSFSPRALLTKARFGLLALRSCDNVARARFRTDAARALFAGCAAHSVVALDRAGTASFGLVLAATAHAIDWPCARGGSQQIIAALVRSLAHHGGTLECNRAIASLAELPPARAILFDTSPRQLAHIAGEALPSRYRDRLLRFRPGPAVFKIDWALRQPIPWRNAECRAATTVHVAGTYAEVLRSESEMMSGHAPEKPFVLVAQQSLIDPTRAPASQHTGWAYCHVPNRCPTDMTDRIESQIERFAPGFRDCILARHVITPTQLEARNPTMLGGDMAGGENTLAQFLFRPLPRWNPHTTPNPRLFLCSSSTPPGGGVHGMCGHHAARAVLHALSSSA